MTPFVFFVHKRPERAPSFEIELFADREPALDHGRRLLLRDALCNEVVVTEDDREIARLSRAAAGLA